MNCPVGSRYPGRVVAPPATGQGPRATGHGPSLAPCNCDVERAVRHWIRSFNSPCVTTAEMGDPVAQGALSHVCRLLEQVCPVRTGLEICVCLSSSPVCLTPPPKKTLVDAGPHAPVGCRRHTRYRFSRAARWSRHVVLQRLVSHRHAAPPVSKGVAALADPGDGRRRGQWASFGG